MKDEGKKQGEEKDDYSGVLEYEECHGRSVSHSFSKSLSLRGDKIARDRGIVHMINTRAYIT